MPSLYVIDDQVQLDRRVRGVTGGVKAGTRWSRDDQRPVGELPARADGVPGSFEFIPTKRSSASRSLAGPLSALYGANAAFVATVNVITRDPVPACADGGGAHDHLPEPWFHGGSAMASYGDSNRGMLVALTLDQINRPVSA